MKDRLIKNYLLSNEDALFDAALEVADEIFEIQFYPNTDEVKEDMAKEPFSLYVEPRYYLPHERWFKFVYEDDLLIDSYTDEEMISILKWNVDKIIIKLKENSVKLDDEYLMKLLSV